MNRIIYSDQEKNSIRFSHFTRLESDCPFRGLGIKYVAAGEETYYANNKRYRVKKGEYVIGNDFTQSVVQIDQRDPVQGLCIDISAAIISEVATYHDCKGTELQEFLLSDQFFVNRYTIKNTGLGYSLSEINQKISSGIFLHDFQQQELFYDLAASVISDQRFVFDHLRKMDFKKQETNEDIFRAVFHAKSLIEEKITENLSLETIALQAGLSKYHFIRVFKSAFGTSPYQYQKKRRLELAKTALTLGAGIADTALKFGFTDAASFTKAFKQQFNYTPGSARNSNF